MDFIDYQDLKDNEKIFVYYLNNENIEKQEGIITFEYKNDLNVLVFKNDNIFSTINETLPVLFSKNMFLKEVIITKEFLRKFNNLNDMFIEKSKNIYPELFII